MDSRVTPLASALPPVFSVVNGPKCQDLVMTLVGGELEPLWVIFGRILNLPLLRLHCAPSLAQWLLPRLRRLLSEVRGLEVRISAGTDYTRFVADDFDADIVYGAPPPEFYSGVPGLQGMDRVSLGTEVVTPLCSPELAPAIRSPRDLYAQTLIESDNKKVRWTDWFAANDLLNVPTRSVRNLAR